MRQLLLILIVLALGCAAHASLVPQIYNSGFEESTAGWGWRLMNGCRASCHAETRDPHSGKQCLVFVSQSALAPNV